MWRSDSATEIVLMVTHGIDEAILLSDRIVIMANPPKPSIEVILVNLPRPRDRVSVIDHPEFRQVQARLMRLLVTEAEEEARLAAHGVPSGPAGSRAPSHRPVRALA